MPVEIKELIIRAVATDDSQRTERLPGGQLRDQERETIIEECVRQILRILKKTKER